ncbi:MAG: DUF4209 domain-containing protein [Bryobacterales bacterium]|nr:DUF4209 domain-containing protein [Bryobacterales bacterium]
MKLSLPAATQAVLKNIDDSRAPIANYEIHRLLPKGDELGHLTGHEKDGAWAESVAFAFRPTTRGELSPWNTYFTFNVSWRTDEGRMVYAPNIEELDAAIIDHWQERAGQAKHPVLRSRYSDLVWDFKKSVTGARPDIVFGRGAIDAYLESVSAGLVRSRMDACRELRRALSIGKSINDKRRQAETSQAMLTQVRTHFAPEKIGTWVFAADELLLDKQILIKQESADELVSLLESVLVECSKKGTENFHPHAVEAAAKRLASFYQKQDRKADVERVIRKWGKAYEDLAHESSPIQAMSFLQPIFDLYKNRGMKEDALRVQRALADKGSHASEDLKPIETKIEISRDEMEGFLAAIVAATATETLVTIAEHFLPSVDLARSNLEHIAKSHPLLALTSVTKIAEGRHASTAGPIAEDPEGRLIVQLEHIIDSSSVFLKAALEKALDVHRITSSDFVDFIFASPIFQDDRRDLIQEGIESYLRGDDIKAIHILIPQIEAGLRRLLAFLGSPATKSKRRGVMQLKNLNDMLREPSMMACLGEDLDLYLLTFLADERGQNIRNRVAHGLVTSAQLNRRVTERLVHILLAMSLIKEQEPDKPSS